MLVLEMSWKHEYNITQDFSPQPHLVENREVHPWLQVGPDIRELVKAALLLLAHAVVECGPALRHTICNADYETQNKQLLTFFCAPCSQREICEMWRTSPVLTAEHSVEFPPPHAVQSDGGALGENGGTKPGRYSFVGGHLVGGDGRSR